MKAEFDTFAQNYRTIHNKNIALTGEKSDFFSLLKVQKVKEWLPHFLKKEPEHILDFGCGDGFITQQLAKAYKKSTVIGVDPSPDIIKEAQKNYPETTFYVSSKELDAIKNQKFDFIVASGVFHHIPFNEHAYYIKQIVSLLKPGGVIILFELNPLNPGTRYFFNTCPFDVDAQMLYPWYAKKLFKSYTDIKTALKYYAFFPKQLSFLRPIEPHFEWLPCSGLYACIAKKANS